MFVCQWMQRSRRVVVIEITNSQKWLNRHRSSMTRPLLQMLSCKSCQTSRISSSCCEYHSYSELRNVVPCGFACGDRTGNAGAGEGWGVVIISCFMIQSISLSAKNIIKSSNFTNQHQE
ncbi:unnamed protein product [Ectocarpus sp. 12 AP-2014]